MLNNSRVDLLLLSLADGRQGLVTAAKQLTHQVINNQLRIEAIIPSHVDAVMQGDDAQVLLTLPHPSVNHVSQHVRADNLDM